jgi:hypothetical protein
LDSSWSKQGVGTKSRSLSFNFFGVEVEVTVTDPECKRLLLANHGFFQASVQIPVLSYVVDRRKADRFLILRGSEPPLQANDDGEFLFLFEKDLTIELQKLRPALYFVHAAALQFQGKGLMLIAMSGGGKSTTTWALCNHGFRYLSDELGPVDLTTLEVVPYPHALNLKKTPPSPYALPPQTVRTSRTLHVPVEALPGGVQSTPAPLAAIFFLFYRPDACSPEIQPVNRAEAGARLFANALNALAHPGEGLDAALELAARCSCFELTSNDLRETCRIVSETMETLRNSG